MDSFCLRVPRPSRRELAASARLSAKCTRRHLRIKMKELMAFAAGLPTIFQDREDMRPKGLRATDTTNAKLLYQRETSFGDEGSLHGRTTRPAGRGAHLLTGGVTHNGGGPLRVTRPQKTRAKNAGLGCTRAAPIAKKPGGLEGVRRRPANSWRRPSRRCARPSKMPVSLRTTTSCATTTSNTPTSTRHLLNEMCPSQLDEMR
jgi:hypothetical protein